MRHLITTFIKNSVFGMNEMNRFNNTGAGFMNIDESLRAQLFPVHSGHSHIYGFFFLLTLIKSERWQKSTNIPTLESEK